MSDIENNPSHLQMGDQDQPVRSNFQQPEELEKQVDAINQTNKRLSNSTTNSTYNPHNDRPLDRWPTLFEILNKKTQTPVDMWSFYVYMRDGQKSIDYLDFWMDTVQHMALCKSYVKSLRQSLVVNERIRNAGAVTQALTENSTGNNSSNNNASNKRIYSQNTTSQYTQGTNLSANDQRPPTPSFMFDSTNYTGNRESNASSRDSRTSSMLLDLLMRNNLLEESDPHRVSSFLRGEGSVRSSDPLVNAKIDDLKRLSQVIDMDEQLSEYNDPFDEEKRRMSRIKPEMVETLIQYDLKKSNKTYDESKFVSRTSLRKSSRNIMLTYFIQDAKKKLDIPQAMIDRVIRALEIEGRDDPEVFDESREYVFKVMEHEAYPNFLRENAMSNISYRSAAIRLIIGLVCFLAACWTGYSLIFTDHQPKRNRAVVTIPFFIAFYCLFNCFFRIDPFLCFFGYTESKAANAGYLPIREPFVKKLLRKRSLFVLLIICLVAAAFSCIFALVPGKRLVK